MSNGLTTHTIDPNAPRVAYLTELRIRSDYSQREMANLLGLSLRAYSDLETGVTPVRKAYILAAEFLSIVRAARDKFPAYMSEHCAQVVTSICETRRGFPDHLRSVDPLDTWNWWQFLPDGVHDEASAARRRDSDDSLSPDYKSAERTDTPSYPWVFSAMSAKGQKLKVFVCASGWSEVDLPDDHPRRLDWFCQIASSKYAFGDFDKEKAEIRLSDDDL